MTTETKTVAEVTMATKLFRVPLLRRIQNSNYSNWETLRYEEIGSCEVVARYGWSGGLGYGGGGGVVANHDGEQVLGYLSARDDGTKVVVLSAVGLAPGPDSPVHFLDRDSGHDQPENISRMLKAPVGRRLRTGKRGRGWIIKLPHPTTESKFVVGLV